MVNIEQVRDDLSIYKIYVPLPKNPLKNLNCYVIKTPTKNLIIDTGFNRPESKEALLAGLKELDIDMDKTELYITHLHADHTGLISTITNENTIIYMTQKDYQEMYNGIVGDWWEDAEKRMMLNGFPLEEIITSRETNPARVYDSEGTFPVKLVGDGDIIQVGDYSLRVVCVPGHTPGNSCLYLEKEKVLFSGDHILFDITPNITVWRWAEDSLGDYLDSLQKVRKLDIELTLPAHRKNDMDVYERIDQLLLHHKNRLNETLEVIKRVGPATAYEIAGEMTWSMRGKKWCEFPVHQKWFAVGETIAHLKYLLKKGKVVRIEVSEDLVKYNLCPSDKV